MLLGGGPIDPALRRRAEDAGVRVVATYGSAETAGGCVYDGYALDGVAVALDAGGRIRIGGPTLFEGYDGDPAATAEVLVDGWFLTSDAGRLDEDGRLHVLGRIDDVVVSGGVNVPAPAVAARLREHPDVVAAEVLGVPDEEWGNRLVAFVVGVSTARPPNSRRAPGLGRRGAPAVLGAAAAGRARRDPAAAPTASPIGSRCGGWCEGLQPADAHPLPRHHRARGRADPRPGRVGGVEPVPGVRRRGRRALAALRRGGRRRRLAGTVRDARAGQRHRPRGRSRAGARDRAARRLPHRQGQGRRARADPRRRPGPARGGPRRARPRRPGAHRRQRALGPGHRRGEHPGARPGRRRARVRRAAGRHRRGPGAGTPGRRRTDRRRRVDPPGRRPLPGARPRGRRRGGAQGAAARRRARLPADRRGHRAAGGRVVGAGDVDRDRRRGRARGRAAGAALRLRPRDRAAARVRRRGRVAAAGRRCPAGAAAGRGRVAGARVAGPGGALGGPAGRGPWPCGRIDVRERHRHRPRRRHGADRGRRHRGRDRPGLAQRPALLRGVRRGGRRAAPAAHPHRRAHGRLPGARAHQERQPRGRGLHLRHRASPTCTRPCSRPRTPGCRWSSSPPTGRPGCAAPTPTRPPTRSASSVPLIATQDAADLDLRTTGPVHVNVPLDEPLLPDARVGARRHAGVRAGACDPCRQGDARARPAHRRGRRRRRRPAGPAARRGRRLAAARRAQQRLAHRRQRAAHLPAAARPRSWATGSSGSWSAATRPSPARSAGCSPARTSR